MSNPLFQHSANGTICHNNNQRRAMSEWSKERAWKARTRDERVVGSNPTRSASYFSPMFPDNSNGVSWAVLLKWMAILFGGILLYQAIQGIVFETGSTNRFSEPLTGSEARRWGLYHLPYAAAAFAISWAIWFFWQRREE